MSVAQSPFHIPISTLQCSEVNTASVTSWAFSSSCLWALARKGIARDPRSKKITVVSSSSEKIELSVIMFYI